MHPAKSLSINITANLITQVSAVVFPLVTFPYVSRVLRPEGLGRVSFAESVTQYFILFATLGIPLYGVRESAKRRDDKKALSTLAVELFLLNLIVTAIATVAFGVFLALSHKARSDPALFCICVSPMFLLPLGCNWLLGGLEEYVYIAWRTLGIRVCVLIGVFLLIRTQDDYRFYALLGAVNAAGASLVNVFWLRRHISVRSADWRGLNLWRHVRPILLLFSMAGAVSIYTSLNQVILGCLTTEAQVGFYSAADRMVKVVVMIVASMSEVLLPRVSYCLQSRQWSEYQRLTATALRLIAFVGFPAAAGLLALAGSLVPALSGQAFLPAVPLVQIMGVNVILIAVGNFMGYQILYPHGREKTLVYCAVLGAVCSLGLNGVLIPRWQAFGAACATLITEACVTGTRIVLSRRCSDFTWPARSMLPYALTALSMAVFVRFLRALLAGTVLPLLICIGAGAAFYVIVMRALRDCILLAIWSRLAAGTAAVARAVGAET